jgi:hypothetical protein
METGLLKNREEQQKLIDGDPVRIEPV